ncbi:MAG TPA: hypothetical protein PKB12_11005, partial [Elusimicrobiota bacterium]|nr:hypothetical protein [Elusimicrobiota bacterium]
LRLRIENDGGYPLPNQPPKNIRNRSFTPATAEPLIYSSRGVESGSGAGTAYIAVYFNQIYRREVPKELTSRARLAWTQRTLGPNRYRIALTVNIPLHSAVAARGGAIPAVTAYWEPKFVSLLGERWGRYLYRAVAGPTLEDLFGGLGNSESINSALLLPMVVGAVMNLSGDPVLGAFVPAFILLFNRLLFVVRHPEGQRTEAGFIAVLGGAGAFAVAWMGAFSPVAAALGFLAGWSFHVATNAVSNLSVLFQGKPREPSAPSTPARTKIGLVLLMMGTLFLSPMYRGGGSALIGAAADRWAGWTIAAAGLLVLVTSGNPLMNAKRGLDRLLTSAFARGISNRWTNLI